MATLDEGLKDRGKVLDPKLKKLLDADVNEPKKQRFRQRSYEEILKKFKDNSDEN